MSLIKLMAGEGKMDNLFIVLLFKMMLFGLLAFKGYEMSPKNKNSCTLPDRPRR
jgi:hypothetical protein